MKRQDVFKKLNFVSGRLEEPEVDNSASEFINQNYMELVSKVKLMGIDPEKAYDLVHDVYISILKAEQQGEGFTLVEGERGKILTVCEFVYGRLKGYSKNIRYHHIGKEVPASCDESCDFSELDSFQKVYASQSVEMNDIEDVEEFISIKDQIEYCMSFNELIGFNIINLLKNVSKLGKIGANKGIFDQLKKVMKEHNEFSESLYEVINFAVNNKKDYDRIIKAF